MASAYMNDRLNGGEALFPKTNFYLNKDLTDYFNTVDPQKYTKGYLKWYEPATDVQSYGFRGKDGKGGQSSTETQFVANPNERKVPDSYKLVSRGDVQFKPTEAAERAYFQAKGRQVLPVDQQNFINAGLGRIDASEGLGFPGYVKSADGRSAYYEMPDREVPAARPTGTNILDSFSDAITEGLEGIGQGVSGAVGGVVDGLTGLLGGGPQLPITDTSTVSPGFTSAINPAISEYYKAILGRDADAEGASFYDAELDAGRMDLPQIQQAIANSEEGRTYELNDFYQSALGRPIEQGALQSYLGQIQNGATLPDLEAQILRSPEAQSRGITEADFARLLGPEFTATLGPNFTGTVGPSTVNTQGPGSFVTAQDGSLPTNAPTSIGSTSFSGSFDPSAYRAANQDVAAAGINPLQHWLQFGLKEGRDIDLSGREFDAATYRLQNSDVAAAGIDPLEHFATYGFAEGRQASLIGPDGFTSGITNLGLTPTQGPNGFTSYAAPDGTTFSLPPLMTSTIGPNMAGTVGPTMVGTQSPANANTVGLSNFFQGINGDDYLKANPDVAASGMSPMEHLMRFGAKEDRNLSLDGLNFNDQSYLAKNQDVARSGMNPLQHYFEFGAKEGRLAELIGPDGTTRTLGPSAAATAQLPAEWAKMLDASFAPTQGPSMVATQGPNMVATQGPEMVATQGPADFATAYLAANPDVRASGMDAMDHFQRFGRSEGRAAGSFDLSGISPGPALGGIGQGGVTAFGQINPAPFTSTWSQPFRPGFTGYAGSNGTGVYGDGAAIQASNSVKSQANAMAIQANDAANWAAAQEAASLQRELIGAGAPGVFVNPRGFNPGTPGAGFQNPIDILPTIAAPTGPAFALNLSAGAMPGGGFAMSGFR